MRDKRILHPALTSLLLIIGFSLAVLLRLTVGGPGITQSPVAGITFAVCLVLMSITAGVSFRFNLRAILMGLAGGLLLCLPPIATRLTGYLPMAVSFNGYWSWALVVSIVALAEEVFLRGALFEAVTLWRGSGLALLVGAVAFAMLHVPLYGWHAVPLDFAVGLFLGILRLYSGSVIAPGVAHVVADLLAWWLR